MLNDKPGDPPAEFEAAVQAAEAAVQAAARRFTEANLNNPGPPEYLLIHNAMLEGWQLGVKQAIAYMKKHGIQL